MGTSPRTRGKHRVTVVTSPAIRNIPAHAGKTRFFISQPDTLKEHPRARGENVSVVTCLTQARGTSPRTRGKLEGHQATTTLARNIPAHAGKTCFTVLRLA